MERRIRTVIVDDEPSSRRAIEIQLRSFPDVEVVGQAADGAAAVDLIQSAAPDLVFLDIQMPELDGFEVVEELGPDDLPRIVFVTAHDEFAVRAFEVSATDYILKPVDERKLQRAIDRVRRDIANRGADTMSAGLRRLMEHLDQRDRSRPARYKSRLLVKEKGEYFFLPIERVDWLEAEGNYVRVHLGEGTHLIRASLNDLEATLDPALFLRIHRGAVVNLDRIETIQPYGVSDYRVILRSGQVVKVGRTYRDALLQRQE